MDRRADPSVAETVAVDHGAAISHISSSSDVDEGRFVPGTLLGGRYRIIGLLGRGGMGEVYRATDLALGQSVALKFLPAEAAQDQHRLERFHAEVRIARQVSHPNVCRVYDIGQAEGMPFISMEYVDGEDLASLNHPNIAAIYGVEERALIMELVEGPTLAERIARAPFRSMRPSPSRANCPRPSNTRTTAASSIAT